MEISELCLGTMSFGDEEPWMLDEEDSREIIERAIDRGVNFFDTANSYQLAERLGVSEREELVNYETMQNHYHLAYREEEREMLPLTQEVNIGVIPWEPLGEGFLTRPFDELEATDRGDPENSHNLTDQYTRGGREINERVQELAAEHGVPWPRSPWPGSTKTSTSRPRLSE